MTAPASRIVPLSAEARLTEGVRLGQWVERGLAVIALACAAPLLAIACAGVRMLSGRSPLIAHERVGLYGRRFSMLKIRTMWSPGESSQGGWVERVADARVPARKGAPDPRVTSSFARLLRRYSIDELPQLVHVATGRMRFVGPRPLTSQEIETYYGPAALEVLSVPPGLTGLWQIMGRNRLTYAQRRRLDVFLVRHASPRLFARILLATPGRVLSGQDAW